MAECSGGQARLERGGQSVDQLIDLMLENINGTGHGSILPLSHWYAKDFRESVDKTPKRAQSPIWGGQDTGHRGLDKLDQRKRLLRTRGSRQARPARADGVSTSLTSESERVSTSSTTGSARPAGAVVVGRVLGWTPLGRCGNSSTPR